METMKLNSTHEFSDYPINRVCAIIDNEEDARDAVTELLKAGITEDHIDIFSGSEAIKAIDTEAHHGFLAKIALALRAYGDIENEAMRIYGDAIRNGEFVFEIIAGSYDEKEMIHRTLAEHHARQINYFGSWYIEAMTEA
jgi:hypothetical protein